MEKALGGKGRLHVFGITYPSEDRAYCSSKDWPGAWHPENSMEETLPRLLKERSYSSAIIMAPCNDISNLSELSSPEEQRLMGSQSSRNTIKTIENALRNFPTLRKVVCVERPIRVDDMAELSEFSNSELRRLAQTSEFASRITVSSNRAELCRSEEQKVAIFKATNTQGADGIHMRGEKGGEFFTNMLIDAAKMAGLSSSWLGGGRQAASEMDASKLRKSRGPQPSSELESQQNRIQAATWAEVASNNRFYVLQCKSIKLRSGAGASSRNRNKSSTYQVSDDSVNGNKDNSCLRYGYSTTTISQDCNESTNGERDDSRQGTENTCSSIYQECDDIIHGKRDTSCPRAGITSKTISQDNYCSRAENTNPTDSPYTSTTHSLYDYFSKETVVVQLDGNISEGNESDTSSDISAGSEFLPYSTDIEEVNVKEIEIEDIIEDHQPIEVIVGNRSSRAGW